MEQECWFVAFVRTCQEKTVAAQLEKAGVEYYLPVRKEWRKYSDRRVLKDRLMLPRMLFIHCTDLQRRKLFGQITYLAGFMSDRTEHRALVVPDRQLSVFRRIVERAENPVEMKSAESFEAGDRVRVVSGPLEGIECDVASISNKTCLCLRMGLLGTLVTEIEASQVIKLSEL